MFSGHKTRSVFESYNIVNEDDLKRASQKVEVYNQKKEGSPKLKPGCDGHIMGTIEAKQKILGQRSENKIN